MYFQELSAEFKRKQARFSSGTTVGAAPSGRSSADGDSPNSKVKAVSRWGRKIKPKKFADDEEEEVDGSVYENGSVSITGIPTDVPSGSAVSPVTLASSLDSSVNRGRKLQVFGTISHLKL